MSFLTPPRSLRHLSRPLLPVLIGLTATLAVGPTAGSAYAAEDAGSRASTAPVAQAGSGSAASGTQFKVTNTDGDGLRIRAKPSLDAEILARLPEGAILTLTDGAPTEEDDERWFPVKYGDTRGWSAARYLTRVVALKPIVRKLDRDASFGDRVAATAQSAIGQPYSWAGNAPGGFDCSGFVQWVYTQAGAKLPRDIADQLAAGKKVDEDDLKPGDLVSFENTYRPGLSHVGVYVGDDQFVHASDEAHGVTVSAIHDEYWAARFYRAVRLKG